MYTGSRCKLIQVVLARFLTAIVVMGSVFFVTAGTLSYWHAWVFLAILFIPMFFVMLYLLRFDPSLLERRMRTKEKQVPQKLFIRLSLSVFLIAYFIPGLDHRFRWSSVPVVLVVVADLWFFLGYVLFFLVLRENSYASRIVEVHKGQNVISTGPYAYVRHPMYSAALIMFLFSPLVLGSYWGLIAMIPMPFALVLRIRNEEELLKNELMGYKEYAEKVTYRLMPKIW